MFMSSRFISVKDSRTPIPRLLTWTPRLPCVKWRIVVSRICTLEKRIWGPFRSQITGRWGTNHRTVQSHRRTERRRSWQVRFTSSLWLWVYSPHTRGWTESPHRDPSPEGSYEFTDSQSDHWFYYVLFCRCSSVNTASMTVLQFCPDVKLSSCVWCVTSTVVFHLGVKTFVKPLQ